MTSVPSQSRMSIALEWLKHAFAIEKGEPTPTPRQEELIDRLSHEVVKRGLTVPAIMFLEMSKPMNQLGANALHFFSPLITAVTDAQSHRDFAEFLEHRGSIELLCRRIETIAARDRSANADQG